jgi:hypothetical protein
MLDGINYHAHGENILPSVKSLQNIEQAISNILSVSGNQEYESSNLFEIPLFNKIRGKPQDIIILVLSHAVVHHDIQKHSLGAIQQPTIFKMFHQK